MQSWTTEAIVLKRVSVGEADRVVTLLTPHEGKVVTIAKGVRKMNSSQSAYLEPGNHISTHLRSTSNLPIITQTQLMNQFASARKHLRRVKQMFEVLELADLLFVENGEDTEGFAVIVEVLELLNEGTAQFVTIQEKLNNLLVHLGYQSLEETPYTSILEYATVVAERPIRSYDFLSIQDKDVVK
jgi:DNA repair protein RecO